MTSPTVAVESPLHIVVTCANRKRHPVPAKLHLGDLRDQRPAQRFAAWTRRLGEEQFTVPARDLYGGEHWKVSSTLLAACGTAGSLWICSAGYGLIGAHTPIRPYGATFAAGMSDSVGRSRSEVQDWWARLTDWPGPTSGQPRSFTELARSNPQATILAILSDAYLRACAHDLRSAIGELADNERFSIIGPPGRQPDLDEFVVPVTAALRPVVGGSLQALNVRAAAHLLNLSTTAARPLLRSELRNIIERTTREAPADLHRRPVGQRLTDSEVRAFILRHLRPGPVSATSLLRLLRQSGRSCEQSRFKQLFAALATEGRN